MNKKLNKFLVYNELINQLKLLTINLASTWTDNPPKQKENDNDQKAYESNCILYNKIHV